MPVSEVGGQISAGSGFGQLESSRNGYTDSGSLLPIPELNRTLL